MDKERNRGNGAVSEVQDSAWLVRLGIYERRKHQIGLISQSPEEYEQKIRDLVRELQI